LKVGLNDTQKVLKNYLEKNLKDDVKKNISDTFVFIFHDKEVEEVCSQLVTVCKQISSQGLPLNHYILPKFIKGEICKVFGVRRLVCFMIDFSKLKKQILGKLPDSIEPMKQNILEMLK